MFQQTHLQRFYCQVSKSFKFLDKISIKNVDVYGRLIILKYRGIKETMGKIHKQRPELVLLRACFGEIIPDLHQSPLIYIHLKRSQAIYLLHKVNAQEFFLPLRFLDGGLSLEVTNHPSIEKCFSPTTNATEWSVL